MVEFMSLFNSLSECNANRFFQWSPSQHRAVVCFFFLFIGLFCEHAAAAQSDEKTSRWTVVREGTISVYSDAGADTAARTLERVRTMAELFEQFGRPAVLRPVRILVFRRTSEFEQYRPSPISVGFFQSGAEGDWIVFPAAATDRVLLHEFTHLLLNRTTGPLPQWLEEGLAEFFSTTRVQGRFVEFGLPIPEHQRNLRMMPSMPAEELTAARKTGVHYQDPYQASRFYATAWMLVHMLYSEPRYYAHMPAFVQAIDRLSGSDTNILQVFRSTFGVTMDRALGEARDRAIRGNLGTGPNRRIEIDRLSLPPAAAPVAVSALDIASLQADLLLDCGKTSLATAKYESIIKDTERPAVRSASRGYLALAKGANQEAMSSFAAAISEGSTDPRVVLEYAMLIRDAQGRAARDTVTALLEKAVALDPNFAEVLFLLGVRASDRKDFSQAVEYLTKAVAILPRQSSFWHALGFAQAKAGQIDAALRSANRALRAAQTSEQEDMANALLEMEGMAPVPAKPPGANVITGAGWENPKGDATVIGQLRALNCEAANGPALVVQTETGTETFSMSNPRKIRIQGSNGGSIEWQCGEITPRRVQIEYLRSSRELIGLHFLP